ncbi:MAG: BrnT family toxin [Candidatus Omnitrophica bacterium]|nr:BrnT family toxin [Candidatus Omnitrophota bacterium]
MDRAWGRFLWDTRKERENWLKHGVDFETAARAFFDPKRKIFTDAKHSAQEERFFCLGEVGGRILTVRFSYRSDKIRIFGAGYWRKGKGCYDEKKDRS